jgi:hypothetical protein
MARLVFEVLVLRYLIALAPVVVAMMIWPHLALPISQATVPMLILIYFVETKILTLTRVQREGLMTETEVGRTLDALHFHTCRVLTRIAARKRDGNRTPLSRTRTIGSGADTSAHSGVGPTGAPA